MKPRTPADWAETLLAHYRSDPELADRVASEHWPDLLSLGNKKLAKGIKKGILTAGLHLSPANESGANFCPASTKACREACLGKTAGRMRFTESKRARILRSIFLLTRWPQFQDQLVKETLALIRKADREGLYPSIRLNTTSDLPWERMFPELFTQHGDVMFYDYTKDKRRMKAFLARDSWPINYHLTFSYTGHNWAFCDYVLLQEGNVAIVFHPRLPRKHNGWKVIDGDQTDCRSLDPLSTVVGLHAKGKAIHDTSGFVVQWP
jgi:hypothetical protein